MIEAVLVAESPFEGCKKDNKKMRLQVQLERPYLWHVLNVDSNISDVCDLEFEVPRHCVRQDLPSLVLAKYWSCLSALMMFCHVRWG